MVQCVKKSYLKDGKEYYYYEFRYYYEYENYIVICDRFKNNTINLNLLRKMGKINEITEEHN